MSKKSLKQKVMYTLGTGALACTFAFTPVATTSVAHANYDTWNDIAQAIGKATQIKVEYDEVKRQIITWSNNAKEQDKILKETVEANGLDTNVEHNERVTRVLNQLIEKGNYARKSNQLPFRWRVVNSDEWNAACYPNNYIVVNSTLVDDLQNDDALAMVLSHEMIHGLHQHVANDSANQILYKYGASLLTMNADYIQSVLAGFITNYITVKNTTNVSEGDADESGFYLFTSAGFNPGGAPVEALHMVNLGGSRDVISDFFQPNNHPASATRFKRFEKQMEEYGYNHAKVKNGTNVYIDDKLLLVAHDNGNLKDWENAYLIAGGISKGLHDNPRFMNWNFNDTTKDFLTDDKAYAELKEAIRSQNLYDTFQAMIRNSYKLDQTNSDNIDTKNKLIEEEKKRNAKIEKKKQDIVKDKEYSKNNYNQHFKDYTKLGLRKLALQEAKNSYDLEADYIASGNMARAYNNINNDEFNKTGKFNPNLTKQSIAFAEEGLIKAPSDDKEWLIKNLSYYYFQDKNPNKIDEMANMLQNVAPKDNAKNIHSMHGRASYLRGDIDNAVSQFTSFVSSGGDISDINDLPEDIVNRVKANAKTAEQVYSANE